MRKLTALKMSHFRQGGQVVFFYARLSKNKNRTKTKKSSTDSLCPPCDGVGRGNGFMAVRCNGTKKAGPPSRCEIVPSVRALRKVCSGGPLRWIVIQDSDSVRLLRYSCPLF